MIASIIVSRIYLLQYHSCTGALTQIIAHHENVQNCPQVVMNLHKKFSGGPSTNCSLIDLLWNTIKSRMLDTHEYHHWVHIKLTEHKYCLHSFTTHQFVFRKSILKNFGRYMISACQCLPGWYLGVTTNVRRENMRNIDGNVEKWLKACIALLVKVVNQVLKYGKSARK